MRSESRVCAGWRPLRAAGFAVGCGLLLAAASSATELVLDPQATHIRFHVDSTLHLVEGSARLLRGEIRFDPEGGDASGGIEVDAASADTGNGLRDAVLHGKVLESERFPRILFRPENLVVGRVGAGEAEVRITGHLEIHGAEHPLVVPAQVRMEGERVEIAASFEVPYVDWGMTDPGNFLLSVDDVVTVEIEAAGRVEPPLRSSDLHAARR